MAMSSYFRRKATNYFMVGLCGLATLGAVAILLLVVGYTAAKGISYLNLEFVTQTARPLGEPGGGMRHEIVGTIILVSLASAMGIPLGLLAGAYLAEYGGGRLGSTIRPVADVLTGVPSVVVGIFVYVLLVRPMGTFSALSGGVALAIIMLPVVARTTEEMMKLVPSTYREAALALGIPPWRTVVSVVMPSATVGIVTGSMLAVARIAGETAPLIFTALGNRFGFAGLGQPIAAMPLQIWRYAVSAYDTWHQQAWAASFLLVMLVLLVSVSVRWLTARRLRQGM
ncbi:MAG: phosphate ABC transporter permease PstA [Chloroflexi bacterium]|nr:phosphate ABC transporter permease PstA [Chloroflexota bacterium]